MANNPPLKYCPVFTERVKGKRRDFVDIPNFGIVELTHENEKTVVMLLETFDK